MHRRDVLKRVGALGTLAVAGSASASARRRSNPCSVDDSTAASGEQRRCARPPGTGSTPVKPRREYVGDVEFDVVGSGGDVTNPVTEITISDDGTLVDVRKTIVVRNGCIEIELVTVGYDPASRTLGIATESVNPNLGEPILCTMAEKAHTYEATVRMRRGTVDSVLLTHDGSDVGSETR